MKNILAVSLVSFLALCVNASAEELMEQQMEKGDFVFGLNEDARGKGKATFNFYRMGYKGAACRLVLPKVKTQGWKRFYSNGKCSLMIEQDGETAVYVKVNTPKDCQMAATTPGDPNGKCDIGTNFTGSYSYGF